MSVSELKSFFKYPLSFSSDPQQCSLLCFILARFLAPFLFLGTSISYILFEYCKTPIMGKKKYVVWIKCTYTDGTCLNMLRSHTSWGTTYVFIRSWKKNIRHKKILLLKASPNCLGEKRAVCKNARTQSNRIYFSHNDQKKN